MKQQGSILLISLLFLVVASIMTLVLLNNSVLASRLVVQQQQQSAMRLEAESVLAMLIQQNAVLLANDFPLDYRHCLVEQKDHSCDSQQLQLNNDLQEQAGLLVYTQLRAVDPVWNYWDIWLHDQQTQELRLQVGLQVARSAVKAQQYQDDEGDWWFF